MLLKTAQEIYTEIVKRLSVKEWLQLATMILNEMVSLLFSSTVDESDVWSEDIRELTLATLQHAE